MEPRRHHLVPRFYLEHFSRDGRIGVISLENRRRFVTSIRNAAAETDFYRIDTENGPSFAVEHSLADMEGKAAGAIRMLLGQGLPLPDEARQDLATFLTFQVLRDRRTRDSLNSVAEYMSKMLLAGTNAAMVRQALTEENGAVPTDAEVRSVIEFARDPDRYAVDMDQNWLIARTLEQVAEAYPFLAGRVWQLVDFSESVLFTSDAPVSLWSSPQNRNPFYGIGLATADEVRFPLDRRHALVLAIDPPAGETTITAGPPQARSMNASTLASAYRWVFHHPDGEPFDESETPPARAPIRMSGLTPQDIALEARRRERGSAGE